MRHEGHRSTDAAEGFVRLGGRHPVETILERFPSSVRRLWVIPRGDASLDRLIAAARAAGHQPVEASRDQLTSLCGTEKHQGVVAEAKLPSTRGLDILLGKGGDGVCALALDHVQDPRNFGALLRIAACFGMAGVIYPSRRASPVNQTVVKASAGGAYATPLIEVANLAGAVRAMKKAGWWIVGATAEGGRSPDPSILPRGPACLVLGSEGEGVRPVVDGLLDDRVTIPMPGVPLSLNVSVAGGILLHALASRPRG